MGLTSTPPRIPVIHIGMPKAATKTDHYYILEQAGTNILLTRCAAY